MENDNVAYNRLLDMKAVFIQLLIKFILSNEYLNDGEELWQASKQGIEQRRTSKPFLKGFCQFERFTKKSR